MGKHKGFAVWDGKRIMYVVANSVEEAEEDYKGKVVGNYPSKDLLNGITFKKITEANKKKYED